MIPRLTVASSVLRRPEHILNNHVGKWALSMWCFGCRPEIEEDFVAMSLGLFGAVTRHLVQDEFRLSFRVLPSSSKMHLEPLGLHLAGLALMLSMEWAKWTQHSSISAHPVTWAKVISRGGHLKYIGPADAPSRSIAPN